jgi:hypothetical protein
MKVRGTKWTAPGRSAADGSDMRLMHKRTMDMEINGHEWWSFDGKTIWYDLQTPRSVDFWIAGVNIDTGVETRYHISATRGGFTSTARATTRCSPTTAAIRRRWLFRTTECGSTSSRAAGRDA